MKTPGPGGEPAAAGSAGLRRATALLLLLLLAVNAAAAWSLVSARRGARRLALEDLDWQTQAHARALEAALSGLRGDLILLSQAPPLAQGALPLATADPVARRWSRLDIEGTLLLFLRAHPAVVRLELADADGRTFAAAGRRQGAPVLLSAADPEPALSPALLRSAWPLGSAEPAAGLLGSEVDPQLLLATAIPGFGERLRIEPGTGAAAAPGAPPPAPAATRGGRGELVSRVAVAADGWQPPIRWVLERREEESQIVRSVEALSGRFATAVAANVAVLALTFALGLLAFRQAQRAARLAAENQQQARLAALERQVAASERLASVGRLAAGMAHEINNPLEGMSNYLRLLEDDLAVGQSSAQPAGQFGEARELAAKVREGLVRIAGITRQVLAFASPGPASPGHAAVGQPPKAAVELTAILEHTVELLRATPAFRGVELKLARPAGPLAVEGNPATLGQLFLNLLLNACQAQPAGGEVEIACRANGTRAVVEVSDRGPGLSAEALAHAFEPFYSTRGSSGLGLALSKGIVDDHDGVVRAANRPGGGALFTVELPLSREAGGQGEANP